MSLRPFLQGVCAATAAIALADDPWRVVVAAAALAFGLGLAAGYPLWGERK